MEHELPKVLDGVDEPVTVEELEQVVRRAGQRRRASLVAGAAGLLALGAVAGALARGAVPDRSPGFAAEGAQPPAPSTPGMAVPSIGYASDGSGQAFTSLVRREANGVAIRAYRVAPKEAPPPPEDPACTIPSIVQVGLSNTAAVGMGMAPEPTGDSFAVLGTGGFGHDEGQPARWVIVRAGKGVSTVRLASGGATDEMAPQQGVAVLAVPGPTTAEGVVEGLAADGTVVSSQRLDQHVVPPFDPACAPKACVATSEGAGDAPVTTHALPAGVEKVPGTAVHEQGSAGGPVVTEGVEACGFSGPPEAAAVPPAPPNLVPPTAGAAPPAPRPTAVPPATSDTRASTPIAPAASSPAPSSTVSSSPAS